MYYWRGGLSQSMSSTCTCTVCFQWVVCHMCRHHFISTQTQSSAKQRQICWRQCYSSWRPISTNIVYCVYLNVLDNLIWLCPAQFLSPLTTIVVIWRYISKIEFLKLNFITSFQSSVCSQFGKRRGAAWDKVWFRGGARKKRHLDLTFISGADPLSGVNSPRSWLWNREWLYTCLLQSSSCKIPFKFSRGLKGRLWEACSRLSPVILLGCQ